MIPLQLHLKNFLSYGSTLQTVDFTPYPLICLSGKNGHGKSALLDAITWAIWGQARKTSGTAKADHQLLRLGQNQMLVIFDFEFNGQTYRIRREFALTSGKQYASLDFALVHNNALVSLSQKTIRETQATIESTVGLDYDSFINSAFLRQGQSNEFSKKSPKERKDILATILGLNNYELLRKRAVDKVKQATIEIAHLKKFQEKVELELKKAPELTEALHKLNESLLHSSNEEQQYLNQKNNLEKEKSEYKAQQQHRELLLKNYNELLQEKDNLTHTLKKLYGIWKIIHCKYLMYGTPVHIEKQKKALIEKISFYQQKVKHDLELKEKLLEDKNKQQDIVQNIAHDFQKKVHAQQLLINNLQGLVATKKKQLEDFFTRLTALSQELATLQQERDLVKTTCTAHNFEHLAKQEQQFEKRKMVYHQLITQANAIKIELENVHQKLKFTQDENNPSCPLCEQNLSASRKKFLKTHFVKQEHFLVHRLQRLTHVIKSLKELLIEQHSALEESKKNVELHKIAQARSEELHKHEQKLIAQQKKIETDHKNLEKELQTTLTKITEQTAILELLLKREQETVLQDKEYREVTSCIENITKELGQMADNQAHWQNLTNQLTVLEKQTLQAQEAEQELGQKVNYEKQINDLCVKLKTVYKQSKELFTTLTSYNDLEKKLQIHTIMQQELTVHVQQLQQKKEALLQQKGSLEHEQLKLLEQEQEFKAQQQQIQELEELCTEYQTIATAVSKDGIQALIIEEALPEIEQEANNLLSQLTDNQAHIIIESLRDLKKGGTKETLDIKISDAIGIRPYELFSGGEAFRIDFALRLAISKLLARRAGTSLQTLIIDEGFGSQDEDGLSHIMDALYKIQDSFCKIIIVSHLTSMKDQFPVHFFIEKGSQGSSLRVIEQG